MMGVFISIGIGMIAGIIIWRITKKLSNKMIYKRLSKSMESIRSNRDKFQEDTRIKLKNKLTKEFQMMSMSPENFQYDQQSKDLNAKLNEIYDHLNKIEKNSKVFMRYKDYSL
ncbi:MAG: hypothetical protein KGI19_10545 [Thaumarchaeota archaeon]|nr:hypothetical protein [Nitrososphaerota archaeon]